MADIGATKQVYLPYGGSPVAEYRNLVCLWKTRRSVAVVYGFLLAFVGFTVFFAFLPSSNADSPWFSNIFTPARGALSDGDGDGGGAHAVDASASQLLSIFSFLHPRNITVAPVTESHLGEGNTTRLASSSNGSVSETSPVIDKNHTFSSVNNLTGNVIVEGERFGKTHNAPLSSTSLSSNSTFSGSRDAGVAVTVPSNFSNSSSKGNRTSDDYPLKSASSLNQNPTNEDRYNRKSSSGSVNPSSSSVKANQTSGKEDKAIPGKSASSRFSAKFASAQNATRKAKDDFERVIKELENCDFYDGDWIRDDSYPLYKAGGCSFIDEQFNCLLNGRPDKTFQNYKWKPRGCTLPRLNPVHMMKMLKGKKLAFVGDSLNRNMWESLVCILKGSAKNQAHVFEVNGRQSFKGEASYSFAFKDYKFSIDFFVSPFLVQEWEIQDKNGSTKETLRLDLIGKTSDEYKEADIILFNTGHWWTHDKTSLGKDYYQEGSYVYPELNVLNAFYKALKTWSKWVDANVNQNKSFVLFRGYSESHFSGGQWNSGGACDHEVEPIKNSSYLREYSSKMTVLEQVMREMKTHVRYMNITRMTDYRKDGHPSMYRKHILSDEEKRSPLLYQDCSHWCLPGVPDIWNEILFAELLLNERRERRNKL